MKIKSSDFVWNFRRKCTNCPEISFISLKYIIPKVQIFHRTSALFSHWIHLQLSYSFLFSPLVVCWFCFFSPLVVRLFCAPASEQWMSPWCPLQSPARQTWIWSSSRPDQISSNNTTKLLELNFGTLQQPIRLAEKGSYKLPVVTVTFHQNPTMQTFLVSHLLHCEHIFFPGGFLTSVLWESSTLDSWQPASWHSSLLPWAKALPSWYGQCWAYCQMPLLHFSLQSNYNTGHRFKLRTSRPCKADSRLYPHLSRTLQCWRRGSFSDASPGFA